MAGRASLGASASSTSTRAPRRTRLGPMLLPAPARDALAGAARLPGLRVRPPASSPRARPARTPSGERDRAGSRRGREHRDVRGARWSPPATRTSRSSSWTTAARTAPRSVARSVARGRHARRVEVVDGAECLLRAGWASRGRAGREPTSRAASCCSSPTRIRCTARSCWARAVAALEGERADLVTVAGRQLMGSFWERLVQPQVFMTMLLRFHDVERCVARGRWRDAIANGQFLLFRRDAYEALGGHEAVRDEVVEDLALAQRTVRDGPDAVACTWPRTDLATRMYRSLGGARGGLVEEHPHGRARSRCPPGCARSSRPRRPRRGSGSGSLPPLVLLAAALGVGGPGAARVVGARRRRSASLLWSAFTAPMGAPAGTGCSIRWARPWGCTSSCAPGAAGRRSSGRDGATCSSVSEAP